MKRAALGIRMHSGWGILVAVSGDAAAVEILERRRFVITDPEMPGAIQPYHHAATLDLAAAEKHLASCASISERMALAAIREVIRELNARGYGVAASAVLAASGRSLPPLPKILAAHPLIHTAEGEFFRLAVRKACQALQIPVTAISEKEVDQKAKASFGNAASRIQRSIAALGNKIGPPWTKDHKAAALAALMVLPRGK